MVKYKERFNKYEKNRWAGLTISLCLVVVFYMLVSHVGSFKEFFNSFLTITSTVIIGAVIAYTVNPLACFIYKRLKKGIKKNEDAAWILSAVISLIPYFCSRSFRSADSCHYSYAHRKHHYVCDGTFRLHEQP